MARSFSYSGAGTVYTPYYGYSRGFIKVESVSFNESTGKITITWDLGFACDSGATGASVAAVAPFFGGVIQDSEKSSNNGSVYYGNYMVHAKGTVTSQQGSYILTAGNWTGTRTLLDNKTHVINATASLTYGVRAQMGSGWGWSARWENSGQGRYQTPAGKTLTFTLPQYDIVYNTNGGSTAPATQTKNYGTALTLTSSVPTKSNTTQSGYTVSFNSNGGSSVNSLTATNTLSYTFKNWNTNSAGTGTSYNKGASYTANTGATLYAQYDITTTGGAITLPSCTRDGYTFVGWSDGSKTYTGTYVPSSNITLTAVWDMNPPGDLHIFREKMETTTEQISITVYAYEGIIDSLKLLYREKGTSEWLAQDAIIGASHWVTGLEPDTDYEFGLSASNAEHTTYLGETSNINDMAYETYSTLMTKPYTPNVVVEELTPFTIKISGHSGSDPERELKYAFSIDGGSSWSDEQASNMYVFEGLMEETAYMIGIKAITQPIGVDASSTSAIGYLEITTPADQARAKTKINGKWETTKMYIKENGEWKKIKKMYIKKNGQWFRAEN